VPENADEPVDMVELNEEKRISRPIHADLAPLLVESLADNRGEGETEGPSGWARALLLDATKHRADAIHLDPDSAGLRVRMRIDGAMEDAVSLTPQQGNRLVNQFKTLAGVDPVVQFNADEARITLSQDDREIDLRLALIPSLEGEKLTIRVLDPGNLSYGLDELGLDGIDLTHIRRWFDSLGGMFLVAGPVGAGKTTTLYSLLHALKPGNRSVITLEDPVEYSVDGITQIQIDEEHGLTFAAGITALARHDPDVVLVGELRDGASVQAACAAAALGRAILATLHARDAVGTLTALRYFGVDDRDIASTVSVVVAQRLVRKLCAHCRRRSAPTAEEKRWFEFMELPVPDSCWEPGQCDECRGSGYWGRTGVFEVWRLEEDDYHLLLAGATEREIRGSLSSRGHRHFLADALQKAEAGTTSVEEVRRLRLAGPAFSPVAASVGV